MFFSFTFSIPTPFANPFEGPDPGQQDYGTSPQPKREERRSESHLSRKRGRWSPEAKARASSSVDVTNTASAYIDSPAKYVDFSEERETESELRAPKRRRIVELTDSIISTAFSAAVIGTAVGLTAYRLWRDRGKDDLPPNPEPSLDSLPPPPPYTERPEVSLGGPAYLPIGAGKKPETPIPRRVAPRPNTGKRQHAQGTRRRRPVSTVFVRNQSPAASLRPSTSTAHNPSAHNTACNSARTTPAPDSNQSAPGPASGDELDDADMQISGQMDWMSSQLQALINEGKRALGTEVVVGGEDEVDDGTGGWDDDEPDSTPSRAPSRTTRSAALGRSTSRASRARPTHARTSSASASSSVKKYEDDEHGLEVLYTSPLRPDSVSKPAINNDGTSEELRIAMERVRKAYGLR